MQIKRVVRKPPEKPKMVPVEPEYCISDEAYENINNIIWMCGTSMEKTARSFQVHEEEDLRDWLLATLNTHYEAATGETFRKTGKTDIQIEAENKAAYIGECKIWRGVKVLQEAVQQVYSYATWRDLKVSVIIFNKENKSFQPILEKIQNWVEEKAKSYTRPRANQWICIYHRQDMNVDTRLTILAFDLFAETK